MTYRKHLPAFWIVATALLLAACGQDSGMRGGLGQTNAGNGTQQQSITNTGFYCTATATQSTVTSGQVFQVQVTVSGATGTVTLPGLNATGSGSSFVFSTSYTNTYGTTVEWNPSLTVQDSNGTTKCSFKVLVQVPSLRQL